MIILFNFETALQKTTPFFMAITGKQEKLDFIISCLKKGEERGKILVKHAKKWGTSKSAFDRQLKIAKEQHNKQQQVIREQLAKDDIAAAKQALKKDILTSEERKEILTKIAKGELRIKKPFVIAGKIMEYPAEPDHMDRKAAIAELNKMEGDYEPIASKVEHTGNVTWSETKTYETKS